MRLFATIVTILAGVLLASCASTPTNITAQPAGGGIAITNKTIVTDLQSASYNLDNAVAVGALSPEDPAPKCLHDVLAKAGIEVAPGTKPPASFVPKNDGVASAGAIAYILAQQAKQVAKTGIVVDVSCEALVGRVVLDGAATINKAAIALIPGIPLK